MHISEFFKEKGLSSSNYSVIRSTDRSSKNLITKTSSSTQSSFWVTEEAGESERVHWNDGKSEEV